MVRRNRWIWWTLGRSNADVCGLIWLHVFLKLAKDIAEVLQYDLGLFLLIKVPIYYLSYILYVCLCLQWFKNIAFSWSWNLELSIYMLRYVVAAISLILEKLPVFKNFADDVIGEPDLILGGSYKNLGNCELRYLESFHQIVE